MSLRVYGTLLVLGVMLGNVSIDSVLPNLKFKFYCKDIRHKEAPSNEVNTIFHNYFGLVKYVYWSDFGS